VVIDTPPVGPFADALAVAGVAGRVLALSRARHTPTHELHAMLGRLSAVRAHVLGAVISHF
jgi:protein-tyrosine kinase